MANIRITPHNLDIFSDWISSCPERFREKLQDILNYPPGSPDGAKAYKYSDMGSCEEDIPGSRDTQQKQEAEKAHENKRIAAAWGKYAEAMAAQYLLKQGLPLREWDWSPGPNSKGEIDLISQKGDTIIFVEVKARCGKHDDPWEAIDTKKIRRLCRGANIYLQRQNEFFKYQFDVALLTGSYDDFVFEYIEDAFLCPPTSRGH